ncbi:MAG: rRNA maturation RNase YbeY [bacterium]
MLEIHNFTKNEIDEKLFQRITEKTLEVVKIKGNTEISLAIVGNGRMRKLNKFYRGKNRVTDVLSFENKSVIPYLTKAFPRLEKQKKEEFIEPPDDVKRLGEIIICYPQAKKQSKLSDYSLEKELTILLIHGILHLLGYDHEKEELEAQKMEKMEKDILNEI